MNNLSTAITKARSIEDLNEIFAQDVKVELGIINDQVMVNHYTGVVTTDAIANKVMELHERQPTEASRKLADLLAEKVFMPLKRFS